MKRALVLGVWFPWSMALILASGLKSCDKPSAEVCKACLEHPELPGCAEVIKACQTPPTTTTTTTRPPDPTPTPTPTPTPVPTPLPTPVPTPTPSKGCSAPQGASWEHGGKTARFDKAVNHSMQMLTGCDVGSDCRTGSSPQEWQARVVLSLRDHGFCAGQHEMGVTDEIAVACDILSADDMNCLSATCSTFWEGKHVANFSSPDNAKVVWSPGADRDSWKPSGCEPNPTPTPTPTPLPTPGPTPTPGPACPIPPPGDDWIGDLKPESGQNLDLTVWVGNPTHTKDKPYVGCLPRRCPLAAEKGDVALACQLALFGTPVWGTSGGVCTIIPRENGFTVKVATGSCALFAKGSVPTSGRVGPWEVSATVPACHVGTNGLCQ